MFCTFYKQMQFFEEVRFFVVFHVTKLEPNHISFDGGGGGGGIFLSVEILFVS